MVPRGRKVNQCRQEAGPQYKAPFAAEWESVAGPLREGSVAGPLRELASASGTLAVPKRPVRRGLAIK